MIHLDNDSAAAAILELYDQRRRERGPLVEQMRAVAEVYNGDVVLPLPELSAHAKATVTNITRQGLDQVAMRIASVMPNIEVPSMRPGFARHDDLAADRRRAWLGMAEQNVLPLLMGMRARWLLGYSQSPVRIAPDFTRRQVRWRAMNPLSVYPAWVADRTDFAPPDVIHASRMRWKQLAERYPHAAWRLATFNRVGGEWHTNPDDLVEILDYEDSNERICVAVGRTIDPTLKDRPAFWEVSPGHAVVLHRTPNRIGRCPWVVPGRLTLDRLLGMFDGVVGMHHTMTELMALSIAATRKGIIGETWLVARPNETPNIVQAADPMTGQPGIVEGAALERPAFDPQWATYAAVDRLEKASRESAGVPGDLTGTPHYARTTGRRADQLLSATIDFPIQEHQRIFAESMRLEFEIAAQVDRDYFANERRTFHLRWPKAKGHVDYVPGKLWADPTPVCHVSYALAGADSMMLNVELAQRVGAGTMSKSTAMDLDPMVEDPEVEKSKITKEQLEAAFLASIQTQAQDPMGPWQPADFARLVELVAQGDELPEAVLKVQREAQERQATPTDDPAAAQPGLSPPGVGVEQELATIGPPARSMANLAQLLRSTTTTGYEIG